MARTLVGGGSIDVAGGGTCSTSYGRSGGIGKVRLEPALGDAPLWGGSARSVGLPGPIAPLFASSVRVVSVNGAPSEGLAPQLIGRQGATDLIVPTVGPLSIAFETREIPLDTGLAVTLKAKTGKGPSTSDTRQRIVQTVPVTPCDAATGICTPVLDLELAAGKWTIETRATFSPVPAP